MCNDIQACLLSHFGNSFLANVQQTLYNELFATKDQLRQMK